MVYAFLKKIAFEPYVIKKVFKSLKNASGRMQVIKKSRYFLLTMLIHRMLEKLLISVRSITKENKQKLICVFWLWR